MELPETGERFKNLEKAVEGKFDKGYRATRDRKYRNFYTAILDYARVAVTFASPGDTVEAVGRVQKAFECVGVKNGMAKDATVPVGGYRDAKLLVKFALPRDVKVKIEDGEVTVPK